MDPNFRFRASGDTPHRPRGEAASHRSRLPLRRDPPSGRDLDDGTVSQLFEELAGEMNRPSDRKKRISGDGGRTWRGKAKYSRKEGAYCIPHDAEFSAGADGHTDP